jgi:hypothetical protein
MTIHEYKILLDGEQADAEHIECLLQELVDNQSDQDFGIGWELVDQYYISKTNLNESE